MNHVDMISEADLTNKFGNLDNLFVMADKDGDGCINPIEAKNFFPQFGLPNQFLSLVWKNCVHNPSGMDRDDFTRAMKFIYTEIEKQQTMTPRGFNTSPHHPMMGTPSPVPHAHMGPANDGINYAISPQERSNYEAYYHKLAGNQPTISGDEAKNFFLQSRLDSNDLKQIWQLADIERRGMLDKHEFCIAMHLIRLKVKDRNLAIPLQLPPVLLPPGKTAHANITGFEDDMPNFSSPAPTSATPHSVFGSRYGSPTELMRETMSPSHSMMMPSQRTGGSSSYGSEPAPSYGSIEKSNVLIKGARALHDSVQSLLNETKNLTTDMFTTQNQVTDREEQLEKLRQEEKDLKEKSEQLKQQLEKSREERLRLDKEVSGHTSKIEFLRHEKEVFERELAELAQEISRLNEVKHQGEGSTLGLSKEVQDLEEQVQYNQQELIKQRDAIIHSKRSHDTNIGRREELELEVRQIKQQLSAAQEEYKSTRAEIDDLNKKITFFEGAKSEYSRATDQTRSQLEELHKKKHDLTQHLDSCKKDLAEFEKQFSSAGNKAKQARLVSILETTTEFLDEFDKLMKEQRAEAAKSPASQATTPGSSTTPTTGISSSTSGEDDVSLDTDFESEFGKHFDEFEKKTESSKAAPAPAPAVTDFGFDDFDEFAASENTSGSKLDPKDTDSIRASVTPATSAAFLDPSGFEDAFGEDDFTASTQNSSSASPETNPKPVAPSIQTSSQNNDGFDDGFGDFGSSSNDGWGMDAFDEFKNNNSSTTKTTGVNDFGFDDGFGNSSESQPASDGFNGEDWAKDFDDGFA